ncbi:hypothetical protein [Streptomyces sp. NPDC002346]
MSTRDQILRAMTEPNSWGHYTPETAGGLLDAYRAESTATSENYPGELAMLRGVLGVVRTIAQHGDIDELRRVIAEHYADERAAYAEQWEKDTAPAATSTPEPLPFTEARAAFMQIGHTHALEGLRTELHIEGHPPLVGRYCGAGMIRAEDLDGVLLIEPRLAFEYAEGGAK